MNHCRTKEPSYPFPPWSASFSWRVNSKMCSNW